jgi:hypothetical protein
MATSLHTLRLDWPLVIVLLLFVTSLRAEDLGSATWAPRIAAPGFQSGQGPVVVIDEAHLNFHTIQGRYRSFARTLETDGYVVRPGRTKFSETTLRDARILVIPTALSEANRERMHWSPPVYPALTIEEIRAVRDWVRAGGSLLLIADHLPFAGAIKTLAAEFGFELINGYALDQREINRVTLDRPFVFERKGAAPRDGLLANHAITRGRNQSERVDRVLAFMGAAFRAKAPATPLIVLGPHVRSYQTETFGKLSATTPSLPASGLMQGAATRFGKGRIVLYAEAGMFGAELQRGVPVGMNHPDAGGNLQLLLNTMHWLDGSLK